MKDVREYIDFEELAAQSAADFRHCFAGNPRLAFVAGHSRGSNFVSLHNVLTSEPQRFRRSTPSREPIATRVLDRAAASAIDIDRYLAVPIAGHMDVACAFRNPGRPGAVLWSSKPIPKSTYEPKYSLEVIREPLEDAVLVREFWNRADVRAEFVDGSGDRDRYAELLLAFLRQYRMTHDAEALGVEAIVALARRYFRASNGDGLVMQIYPVQRMDRNVRVVMRRLLSEARASHWPLFIQFRQWQDKGVLAKKYYREFKDDGATIMVFGDCAERGFPLSFPTPDFEPPLEGFVGAIRGAFGWKTDATLKFLEDALLAPEVRDLGWKSHGGHPATETGRRPGFFARLMSGMSGNGAAASPVPTIARSPGEGLLELVRRVAELHGLSSNDIDRLVGSFERTIRRWIGKSFTDTGIGRATLGFGHPYPPARSMYACDPAESRDILQAAIQLMSLPAEPDWSREECAHALHARYLLVVAESARGDGPAMARSIELLQDIDWALVPHRLISVCSREWLAMQAACVGHRMMADMLLRDVIKSHRVSLEEPKELGEFRLWHTGAERPGEPDESYAFSNGLRRFTGALTARALLGRFFEKLANKHKANEPIDEGWCEEQWSDEGEMGSVIKRQSIDLEDKWTQRLLKSWISSGIQALNDGERAEDGSAADGDGMEHDLLSGPSATPANRRSELARVLGLRAELLWFAGETTVCHEIVQEIREIRRSVVESPPADLRSRPSLIRDSLTWAEVHLERAEAQLGRVECHSGVGDPARTEALHREHFDRAMARYMRGGNEVFLLDGLRLALHGARLLERRGETAQAAGILEEAWDFFDAVASRPEHCAALRIEYARRLARLQFALGRRRDAKRTLDAARAPAEAISDELAVPSGIFAKCGLDLELASLERQYGRREAASARVAATEEFAKRLLAQYGTEGAVALYCQVLDVAADHHAAEGDMDFALGRIESAIELLGGHAVAGAELREGQRVSLLELRRKARDFALKLRRFDRARAHAETAVALVADDGSADRVALEWCMQAGRVD